jgi:hypothetical protein
VPQSRAAHFGVHAPERAGWHSNLRDKPRATRLDDLSLGFAMYVELLAWKRAIRSIIHGAAEGFGQSSAFKSGDAILLDHSGEMRDRPALIIDGAEG